jgi:hypothetical protein
MGKEDNALVIWFRRSLLFRELEVKDIRSPQALGEAFWSFGVGLTFYFTVLAVIGFTRANLRIEFGQVAEFSMFCVVPAVSVACLSFVIFALLWVLRAGPKLESVVVVTCFALGGMFPFVTLGMWPFLGEAVRLALEHQDPSLPYTKAAVYSLLFETEVASPVRFIACLGILVSLVAIGFYLYWMAVLLSKVSQRGGRIRAGFAVICAWFVDCFLVSKVWGLVFWSLIIQHVKGHHG